MFLIIFITLVTAIFYQAAASVNSSVSDVDLTNPLRLFTDIPGDLTFNEIIFLERNGFYLRGPESHSIYHLINDTAVYFGNVRDHIMPDTVGTIRDAPGSDYDSLLAEYGYDADTDYVSPWIATYVVISTLNSTERFVDKQQ